MAALPAFCRPFRACALPKKQTHSLRPFDRLGASCGLHSFAATRLGLALLLRLVHRDALLTGLLLGFGFLGDQGLVNPVIGSLQIFLAGIQVVAFHISLFPVHQVQVGHGIVVIGTELDCFVQTVNALLDRGHVLHFQFVAGFFLIFILGIQVLVRLQAQLGAFFHARLVASRPVDDAYRVVGFRIVGIDIGGHAVELLGVVELFHVQVQVGYPLGGVYFLVARRIHGEDVLVLLNGLLCHFVVVWRVGARDVLLSVSGGQVHLGINQFGVKRNGLLEV